MSNIKTHYRGAGNIKPGKNLDASIVDEKLNRPTTGYFPSG